MDLTTGSHCLRSPQSRRRVLVALAGGGLAVMALGRRQPVHSEPLGQDALAAAADEVGTPVPFTAQVFAGQGFVGVAEPVSAGEAFVAVVVADATPGSASRDVRALLYGDIDNDLQEWFPGTVTGTHLDLVSENGAQLTGDVTDASATGTITLLDGTTLTFAAEPATGIAGLFTVTVFPDGRVEGTSERGVRLEAQIGEEALADGQLLMTGQLIPPDGPAQELENPTHFRPQPESVVARFIFLADGRVHGGVKRKPGGDFSDPDPFD